MRLCRCCLKTKTKEHRAKSKDCLNRKVEITFCERSTKVLIPIFLLRLSAMIIVPNGVFVHFLCLSKENEPKEKTLFLRYFSP